MRLLRLGLTHGFRLDSQRPRSKGSVLPDLPVLVDPPCPRDKQPHCQRSNGDRPRARWRRTKQIGEVDCTEQKDQGPKCNDAGPIAGLGGTNVERHAPHENWDLDCHCGCARIPQTEPRIGAAAWKEWEVRPVNDPIEHPMAENAKADHQCGATVAGSCQIAASK